MRDARCESMLDFVDLSSGIGRGEEGWEGRTGVGGGAGGENPGNGRARFLREFFMKKRYVGMFLYFGRPTSPENCSIEGCIQRETCSE